VTGEAELDVRAIGSVKCPRCGIAVLLGETASGDRVVMHMQPCCEWYLSGRLFEEQSVKTERGDA
jgi:hypothetical protein